MGKIRVADGTLVDPYAPTVADVKLDVFAHSLAQLARFTGHAKFPFSVGQHTMNLNIALRSVKFKHKYSATTSHQIEQAALAHDMSEAWFNDMASPVKKENPDYRTAEHAAGIFIAGALGVSTIALDIIDPFDKRIYKNERTALFPIIEELGMGDDYEPLPDNWLPHFAFHEFEWREIRAGLWDAYTLYFPDNVPDVPFWERDGYNG